MKILYVGTLEWGSTSLQRMRAISSFVDDVYFLDTRIFLKEYIDRKFWQRIKIRSRWPFLVKSIAKALIKEVNRYKPDIVWIDQGLLFSSSLLEAIRKFHPCLIVHYTTDSLMSPGLKSMLFKKAISHYDICFVTKKKELSLYRNLGAKNVFFSWQGYDPFIHHPWHNQIEDKFICDVVFAGDYRPRTAYYLKNLLENVNCKIHLYGGRWNRGKTGRLLSLYDKGWVYGEDYAKAISGAKIALCFLNREVGDDYTTRTFEIPACKTLMIAERTEDHLSLFEEDKEAVYFGNLDELIKKVKYYLINEKERQKIAEAGYKRAINSGYTWRDRMAECINIIKMIKNPKLRQ